MIVDEPDDPRGEEPGREADRDADRDGANERDDGLGRPDRRRHDLQRDREQDQTRAVVEEALAIDHRR